MSAPATADVDAEFVFQQCQSVLQGSDDAGRDARRAPVHAHHGAERLEPEGMREPPQKLIAAVVMDGGLAHDRTELGHALCQPSRNASAMERKISDA